MNATLQIDELSRCEPASEPASESDMAATGARSAIDPEVIVTLGPADLTAIAAQLRGPAAGNILELWRRFLLPANADFDRRYKEIERMVNAPAPAQGLGAIGQSVIKAVVAALETQGKVSKFDVASVSRDPTRPIVFYTTKDGKVIGHCPPLDGNGLLPNVFGFDFDFFGKFGYFVPKEFVVLVLSNGDCILIRST